MSEAMSDKAVEAALNFLNERADEAGVARAQMVSLEHFRKVELARLKRMSPEKTDAGKEAWARAHADYRVALDAQWEAIKNYESLSWKRSHAEATISAWQTRNANSRAAGRLT